jgi:hypothetical protein
VRRITLRAANCERSNKLLPIHFQAAAQKSLERLLDLAPA